MNLTQIFLAAAVLVIVQWVSVDYAWRLGLMSSTEARVIKSLGVVLLVMLALLRLMAPA